MWVGWSPGDFVDGWWKNGRLRFANHPVREYQYGIWQENGEIVGIVVYRLVGNGRSQGTSLLAAYGHDVPELLKRWTAVMRKNGISFVHWVATPHSSLSSAIKPLGIGFANPIPRSPYYLTIRHFPPPIPIILTTFPDGIATEEIFCDNKIDV